MIGLKGGDPLDPARPERFLPRGQCRIPAAVPEPELTLVAPAAQS